MAQRPLIAIDWGTSSLRAARIAADGTVLEQRAWPRGILQVPAGGFAAAWRDAVGAWMTAQPDALCLMSGMVGSQQGWREAPYTACPANAAQIASNLRWLTPGDGIEPGQRVGIVGGLQCEHDGMPDVMRGEETQVLGACALLGVRDATVVLPGTHSKWVQLRDGRIDHFRTAMTGEVYALLRQHSILRRSLPESDTTAMDDPTGPQATTFCDGVRFALRASGLLHSAFSVRTLALTERLPIAQRSAWLSGLVIGEELRAAAVSRETAPLVLVGDAALVARYQIALRVCGVDATVLDAQATWRGVWTIAQHPEANPHS
mgnify:CR=1 FL=1